MPVGLGQTMGGVFILGSSLLLTPCTSEKGGLQVRTEACAVPRLAWPV